MITDFDCQISLDLAALQDNCYLRILVISLYLIGAHRLPCDFNVCSVRGIAPATGASGSG